MQRIAAFVVTALLCAVVPACNKEVSPRPVAYTMRDLRSMLAKPGHASDREVELRGIVTYFDASLGVLYLQDDTGAAALDVGNLGAALVSWQSIVLSGVIEPRAGLLALPRPRITVLGQNELPPQVQPIDLVALLDHKAEAEWVEVHATVRSSARQGRSLVVDIEGDGAHARAVIATFDDPRYPSLVGAQVRLRGTSSARAHAARQKQAIDLFVPSLQDVRIEKDPPAASAAIVRGASALPVLTTAAEVRRLPPSEAAKGYPVRLNAVVTFNNAEQGLFFVQDDSGGVYVEAWRHIHPVQPGDRVQLEGLTDSGAFAPIVDVPRLTLLGHGPRPVARQVRAAELLTGAEDSQWVEIEGVVRDVKIDHYGARVRIADGPLQVTTQIPSIFDVRLTQPFVNARVRARGVCGAVLTVGNQLADVLLHSPDLESLTIVAQPPPDPKVRAVSTLLQFQPDAAQTWEHRVRVQGVVTYSQPGEMYVQDTTGSVFLHSQTFPVPDVGEIVEASGFVAAGDYKPVLQDAEVYSISRGEVPKPVLVTPEEVMTGRFDASLIMIDAWLIDSVRGSDTQQLLMRAGPYVFPATVRDTVPDIRAGSKLRLTGVCALSSAKADISNRSPQSFRVRLRAASDIEVVRAAPWWNPRLAAWVLVAALTAIGLSLAWVTTLRRRVRAQSTVIWERVKRETELQERQRMARELHDTLEQNLAGIGLALEAAARALPNRVPVAEQHLALAVEQVTAGVNEVRRSVWALRTESLDVSGLGAALDEIGQQLARCSPTPIEVRTRAIGDPRPFAAVIENDLLRIGQEALTNAVRHGHASHIQVELRYDEDAFHLRVSDDGRGFDTRNPPRPGHFGLVGMRERAAEMRAELKVRSTVGRGTDIEVVVDVQSRQPMPATERSA
jgi:signal transduction histidine kinase